MDYLEVQGEVPTMFLDLERMFINQYTPLDGKSIA